MRYEIISQLFVPGDNEREIERKIRLLFNSGLLQFSHDED